jgi:hypothetical protein
VRLLAPQGFDAARFDPRQSSILHDELPGLELAFDAEAARGLLQSSLIGGELARYEVAECRPGQASYVPGVCCVIRYQIELRERGGDGSVPALINVRVHPSLETSGSYLDERLAPLAETARLRDDLVTFANPVARIDELRATASVFPIDGELPTLVAATDRAAMLDILRDALPVVVTSPFQPSSCHVELGHYGRQHRCVLKYNVEGTASDGQRGEGWVVYGKVAADGRGVLTGPIIDGLNERVLHGPEPLFTIPSSFGYLPDLQLVLLESIPGIPRVAQLLEARLNGDQEMASEPLALEGAIDACARIAAALHASGIELGARREMDDELTEVSRDLEAMSRVTPELGALLAPWLNELIAFARRTNPLPLCLSHGDFKYTQLIFAGSRSGLVDFDTICQAEPALDLGQYMAYVRVAERKALKAAAPDTSIADALCVRFLDAYVEARTNGDRMREELVRSARLYELVSLFRLAFHSWQKFKASRLTYVIPIIQERLSLLKAPV